jgi:hypothetical protein
MKILEVLSRPFVRAGCWVWCTFCDHESAIWAKKSRSDAVRRFQQVGLLICLVSFICLGAAACFVYLGNWPVGVIIAVVTMLLFCGDLIWLQAID